MSDHRAAATTFGRADRIRKRVEFVRLSRKNRKVSNNYFIALYDNGVNDRTRLGITVSKKVGGAVTRNQLKRYVREFFRRNRRDQKSFWDINIIVKKEASGLSSCQAFESLHHIFNRIR